jgi:hypothetical protein
MKILRHFIVFLLLFSGSVAPACLSWWRGQLAEQAAYGRPDPAMTALFALPKPQGKPSRDDLAFGERQVEQMVMDRPKMAGYLQKDDPVWRYCVRQYAGEAVGQRITWNNEPPEGDAEADHQTPTQTQAGFIRVRRYALPPGTKQRERNGEDLWASAIFELTNIRGSKQFERLYDEACDGKLDKQGFVDGFTKQEYKALQDSIVIYHALWEPRMKARHLPTLPYYWQTNIPPTYEQWIAGYSDPKGYPWNCYGKYFDEEIVPYRKKMKEWEESNRQ